MPRRRAPLTAAPRPSFPGAGLRRTGLRARSVKRAALYRQVRVPLVVEMLAERPVCERCHRQPSVDVHEIKSRARSGSITDRSNLAALCRRCHDHITTHPAEAEREGWSLPSWENTA